MSYEPDLMEGPYVTVGGPSGGAPAESKPNSGWGPLLAVVGLGFILLLGYVGYRVVLHVWMAPSPYSARRAATAGETTVVFPQRLAGLTRFSDRPDVHLPKLTDGAPAGAEWRVATYGRAGVLAAYVGAAAYPLTPHQQVDAIQGVTKDLQKQGGRTTTVDPGPMGGRMVCATGSFGNLPYTACGYVDPGAFGVIYVYDQGRSVRSTVLAIRAGVEHRLA
jgi:hypothetical protein